MNDRFKFRVWNKQENKYINGVLCIGGSGQNIIDVSRLQSYDYKLENYVIEQCTGLKDKNGNLIYEGDIILKSDTNELGYGRIRECNVHWHNDWLGWAITTEYGDTYGLAEYASKQYEIIGNIHEQKE